MLLNDRSDLPNDPIALYGDNEDIAVVAQELLGALEVDWIVKDIVGGVLNHYHITDSKSSKGRAQI